MVGLGYLNSGSNLRLTHKLVRAGRPKPGYNLGRPDPPWPDPLFLGRPKLGQTHFQVYYTVLSIILTCVSCNCWSFSFVFPHLLHTQTRVCVFFLLKKRGNNGLSLGHNWGDHWSSIGCMNSICCASALLHFLPIYLLLLHSFCYHNKRNWTFICISDWHELEVLSTSKNSNLV